MNNIPRFTETNAASLSLIQMPLRIAHFSSCFWQTRTLALPRSMFGSAERVLVDIARKKQMPLRVAHFSSCFWQTRTLALPRSMFGSAERVLVDIARKKQMPLRVACFFFLRYHYTTFFGDDTSEKTLRCVRKMIVTKVEFI